MFQRQMLLFQTISSTCIGSLLCTTLIKKGQHQGLWKPNKINLIYFINLKFHIAALDTLVRLTEIYIVYPLELIATMNYTLLKIRNDTIRATSY